MATTTSPFGSWKSPISSKLVSESSVWFQEIRVDPDPQNADTVYWSEMRYDEGGRHIICSHKCGSEGFTSWTPEGFNARTRVHEYGGGATCIGSGKVYFANYKDQDLYSQGAAGDAPTRLTAEGTGCRFADGQYHIKEDHSMVGKGEVKEEVNTVITVNPADGSQTVMVSGADFYSCPRVSPDGKQIAWVQWCHPNMPWDSTELWVADLADTGDCIVDGSPKKVSGGENISVMQPSWTCDNELLYIGDHTDWLNLYHLTRSGDHVNLLPRSEECGGAQWLFGNTPYMVDPRGNGDIVTAFGKELGVYNMKTKSYRVLETGFTSHSFLNVGHTGLAYCVAGSPTKFASVVQIDTQSGQIDILRESRSLTMDTGYFSVPQELKWKTSEGDSAYGYFYPPTNKDFTAPEGTLPPLLVKIHGGPTSQCDDELDSKVQYFTSRGMAVLDVNYRGSTGYGKQYRNRLRGQWGVYDLDDACSGARFLVDTGRVDGEKLCIDGGSAGGYTTLAALTFRDVFKAGASYYGIGDLEAAAAYTHKFQSRYGDHLIGPYTESTKQVYIDRSPIHFVEKLNCALALFQGDEDEIVPPDHAELIYSAMKAKGLPTSYILFQGEQHGFLKAENIQKALDGEFYFFARVFGYEPADKDTAVTMTRRAGPRPCGDSEPVLDRQRSPPGPAVPHRPLRGLPLLSPQARAEKVVENGPGAWSP